jgi:hypothetical protein
MIVGSSKKYCFRSWDIQKNRSIAEVKTGPDYFDRDLQGVWKNFPERG